MSGQLLKPGDLAELREYLAAAGLETLDGACIERLAVFARLLEKWNRVYNLTGIRDRQVLLERHIVESLALGSLLRGERIADVGSGAGLPGLPLAIAHPERHFTLIESRRKRVNFMRHVIATLELANTAVAHARAEDLSSVGPFATVLARAVAAPARLLTIIRPLTTGGSILVLPTSAEIAREIIAVAGDFDVLARPADGAVGQHRSVVVLERRAGERTGGT